ncbi:MAG: AmpG family muropeptide MFS transporter, partial [Porticoccus sp.]|nr:AmpG family muropeptide MFS transporter [Porticoccus sp.]
AYTATQYALFSSLMTLPGKFFSGFSGVIVDVSSYQVFFVYAALMGLPAIFLSWLLWRHASRIDS